MYKKTLKSRFIVAFLAVFGTLVFLGLSLSRKGGESRFDVITFAELPVLEAGRIKPLDTVARTSLLLLSGKQVLKLENGRRMSAAHWLAELLFAPEKTYAYKVFRIDNPDVLGAIGVEPGQGRLYDFKTLEPHFEKIQMQAARAASVPDGERSPFETAVLNLRSQLSLYGRLQNTIHAAGATNTAHALAFLVEKMRTAANKEGALRPSAEELLSQIKPALEQYAGVEELSQFRPIYGRTIEGGADSNWQSTAASVRQSLRTASLDPMLFQWAKVSDAFAADDAAGFNIGIKELSAMLTARSGKDATESHYETLFNHFKPFYKSMVLYVAALLLCLVFFLLKHQTFNTTAYALFVTGFALHTAGLFARMILEGRPPVTNLYSSAVFVGWGTVLFGVILELKFRRGMITAVAAAVGFATLIIAHHLALQGDTMEMMRAVLDSNFWLATHVVFITIGYSGTFFAGAIGILYLLRRACDNNFNQSFQAELGRILYGALCFSAFFSFVGTVLGGIWADQSWGRFWGWDPKENGALMIVLWVVFILHARSGRLVSEKMLMAMAVFGNVITALAWFGVNMLNIGLHSYGYMDKGFTWLVAFSLSQILICLLAVMPARCRPAGLETASNALPALNLSKGSSSLQP